MASRLNMTQHCALAVLKANSIHGYIKSPIVSRSKEVIIPLYSALVILHLERYVQFWVQQHKKDVEKLYCIQWSAAKMVSWS